MQSWGLDIAVLGPILLPAHLISILAITTFKKKYTRFSIAIIIIVIILLFFLISWLIFTFTSLSSLLFIILFFLLPQILAYVVSKSPLVYMKSLFLSILIGLLIFIVLGALFGRSNIA